MTTGATVIGKPSEAFFSLAVRSTGASPAPAIMVGDDIENDVGGARNSGLRGVLVRISKYRSDTQGQSDVCPDAVIASVAELPRLLGC
ncbi:MAG: HAD hydrolase-like protein [Gammaproteobacteria bacterium]